MHVKFVFMKKVCFISFLLCSIAVSLSAAGGVGHGDYHFGWISASAGYSSLSQNIPNVTTKGDLAYIFGAGYEFRMNNGWCNVGLQYSTMRSKTTPDEYQYIPQDRLGNQIGGLDNQLKPTLGGENVPEIVRYYRYTIRQVDKQQWRSIDIPVMAGYYNSGFYVGAGMKVGFSVGSSITTGGEYDLAAKYERYVGIFESTSEFTHHLYHTYSTDNKKYNCTLRPQFSLIGEIGYDLLSSLHTNSKVCHMLKIGFYWELGLRSVRPNDSLDPIQIQGLSIEDATTAEANVCDAHMTPYYLSTMTEGKYVAPYYVGVKLTYLIGGSWSSTATWHKGCQCYGK